MARAPAAKKAQGPKRIAARVVLDQDAAGDPYYANYAEVASGQYDAELIFARAPAKPSAEQLAAVKAGDALEVPAIVRVVLPVAVLKGLRDAIDLQIEKAAINE